MARRSIIKQQNCDTANFRFLRNLIAVFILTWFIPRPIYISEGSLEITPLRIVGAVLVLYIIFQKKVTWSWIDIFALGPLLASFICTSMSSGIGRAVESTGRLTLDLLTPYLVGRAIAERPAMLRWTVRFVLHCLAFLALFLAVESLARINVHCLIWGVPYTPHLTMRLGMTRAHGWTSHPIMLGLTYAAFTAPAAVFALEKTKQSFKSWLVFGLILSGVFFSLSTGSWCAAFVALAMLYWDQRGPGIRKERWQIAAACVIGGYLGLWALADNPPLMALMYHVSFLSPGWLYRWQLWGRVTSVMPGHWLFGYGEVLPEEFAREVGWSVDNQYLALLLSQGWFGLGAWLIFNGVVIWNNVKHTWFKLGDNYTRILRSFGFTVVGFLVSALTVAIFSTAAAMLYMSLGIAATSPCRLAKRR